MQYLGHLDATTLPHKVFVHERGGGGGGDGSITLLLSLKNLKEIVFWNNEYCEKKGQFF